MSFESLRKEILSGNLVEPYLHSKIFIESNYFKFEENDFELIYKLNEILLDKKSSDNSKKFACFDLGEFARLYPGAFYILRRIDLRKSLVELADSKHDKVLKSLAIEALQKLILKELKNSVLN